MLIKSISEYADELTAALKAVDANEIEKAIGVIVNAHEFGYTIYSCGNGGSAAISDHLVCDHVKGVACDTAQFYPRIVSLPSNGALMTAIANDIGYDQVFAKQLEWSGLMNEVLIVISSSGKSPNIIKALEYAKQVRMKSIAIVGFTGGPCKKLADVCIHIPSKNYGVVEDATQAIMHYMAQTIRGRYTVEDPESLKY
jgi:phosphoheptose isomerase